MSLRRRLGYVRRLDHGKDRDGISRRPRGWETPARLHRREGAVSQLGDWLYNAALLGYVYSATGSAGWVGAATGNSAGSSPMRCSVPVGGAVADRYDRRTVLLVGDVLRCLQMVVLAVVVGVRRTPWPSWSPSPPLPPRRARPSARRPWHCSRAWSVEHAFGPANTLLHTVQDLGVVVGPALGALLLRRPRQRPPSPSTRAPSPFRQCLISTMRRQPRPSATVSSTALSRRSCTDSERRAQLPSSYRSLLVVAMVRVHIWRADRAARRVLRACARLGGGVRRAARRVQGSVVC